MSGAFALVFFSLTLVNLWVGRSLLYPPALFAGTWTIYTATYFAVEDQFYPVSDQAFLLFALGAAGMTFGGILASLVDSSEPSSRGRPDPFGPARARRWLDLGLLLLVACIPLRVMRVQSLSGGRAIDPLSMEFWTAVRQASIEESDAGTATWLSLTDNLTLLALFLAIAGLGEDLSQRKLRLRTALLIGLALLYQLSTGSRASGMTLVFGLATVATIGGVRRPLRMLLIAAAGAAIVFVPAAILQNKGGSLYLTVAENVSGLVKAFRLYFVGGIVAFNHALEDPADVPSAWWLSRSFIGVANKLGAGIPIPSIHAEFSKVSPEEWFNAYTMYFAYFPDLGWFGTVAVLILIGFVLTWLFRLARGGDPRARIVYATAVSGILMSGFGESFLTNLTFYGKAAAFSLVVYGLPRTSIIRPRRRSRRAAALLDSA